MNTVGILIQFQPRERERVQAEVIDLGCEVHLTTAEGKMVVTLEQSSDGLIADTLVALQDISGVLTAALIYHHYDSLEPE